jgi:exodeoxyribonuclease VII small subunit
MEKSALPSDWQYDRAIETVEEIIAQLESGQLPLNTVFEQFGVAVAQLRHCETFLQQGQAEMELQIELLSE